MSEQTLEQEAVQETVQENQVEQPPVEDQFNVLDSIYRDLGVAVEETEAETEEPPPEKEPDPTPNEAVEETVAEETPAEEPAKEEAVQEETAPPTEEPAPEEGKKIYYRKPEASPEDVRKTVQEELVRQQQTPIVNTPQVQPEKQEDPYEGLLPEQRQELELAEFAEKQDEKYKGMGKKLRDFYGKLDSYIDSAHKEDPDRRLDEHDEEFKEFVVKNKPTFGTADQRRLERLQIKEEAVQEAERRFGERESEMQKKLKRLEVEPKIDRTLDKFDESVTKTIGEDLSDPFNKQVYESHIKAAKDVGREYMKLYHGLEQYDGKNEVHNWLVEFVTEQAGMFAKHGGDSLKRDDLTFLTPAEFSQIGNPKKHWTFSPDDVLNIIGTRYVDSAKEQANSEIKRLESLGFSRKQQQQSPPQTKPAPQDAADAEPVTPVKISTNASPGAAVTEEVDQTSYGKSVMSLLGLDV